MRERNTLIERDGLCVCIFIGEDSVVDHPVTFTENLGVYGVHRTNISNGGSGKKSSQHHSGEEALYSVSHGE